MSGIDMDKMKEKLSDLKNGGSSSTNDFWKPDKNSKHRIRLLLPKDGTGDPFKEFWIHYGISSEAGFVCPKRNYNEPCDICEFASEVYQEGKENNSEHHMELAKDLWPSQRFYTPVIERGNEEEGPGWYSYSKTVQEEFLGYAIDPEYNDPTDPKEGHDVKLEYTQGENDPFPSTSIKLSPRSSPLADTDEEIEEILTSIPDIEEVLYHKGQDEISNALEEHMREVNEGMEEDEELEKYGSSDENELEKKAEELRSD